MLDATCSVRVDCPSTADCLMKEDDAGSTAAPGGSHPFDPWVMMAQVTQQLRPIVHDTKSLVRSDLCVARSVDDAHGLLGWKDMR